jgi:hypothetical protein
MAVILGLSLPVLLGLLALDAFRLRGAPPAKPAASAVLVAAQVGTQPV